MSWRQRAPSTSEGAAAVKAAMLDTEKTEKQKARRAQVLLYVLVALLIAIPAALYFVFERGQ